MESTLRRRVADFLRRDNGKRDERNEKRYSFDPGAQVGYPTGLVDVALSAGRNKDTGAGSAMELPGERIYAICYWKVKISKRRSKITPELKSQKNVWRAADDTRGGDGGDDSSDEEKPSKGVDIYQADLGSDDEDTEGWEVIETGVEGDTVRLAVSVDEDPDSEMDDA